MISVAPNIFYCMNEMEKIKLIGIERHTTYSPNHIGNDKKIFDLAVDALRKLGYVLTVYSETDFVEKDAIEADFIVSMARDTKTIAKIMKMEQQGTVAVNSAFGVANCTRARMTQLLIDNGIPHPRSLIFDIGQIPIDELASMHPSSFWVKRGDYHAIHREDVAHAASVEEVLSIVEEFKYRDIPNVVVNEHEAGDLVKFYGVADTDFFHWFYPYDNEHSKFGLEQINGKAQEIPFSKEQLKATCDRAGQILNVKIYGGDCIISSDGSFKIIDFNDWPSFAPCRDEAGPQIAACIHQQIQSKRND